MVLNERQPSLCPSHKSTCPDADVTYPRFRRTVRTPSIAGTFLQEIFVEQETRFAIDVLSQFVFAQKPIETVGVSATLTSMKSLGSLSISLATPFAIKEIA
jgi:hypothetical protein